MAKTAAKCPVCGAIIHVNDEKESGHCVKCGAEINVLESIQLYKVRPESEDGYQREAAVSQSEECETAGVSQRQLRREAKAREAEAKTRAVETEQTIHNMFQLCTNEQDYLMLRPKIMDMNVDDNEKAALLEALDSATQDRLEDVLEKAKDYKDSQESPLNLLIGAVAIAGIGLAINHFLSMFWPGAIAVALAVIGFIGNISDRHDKKKLAENKAAAELIEQYRKLGYKI